MENQIWRQEEEMENKKEDKKYRDYQRSVVTVNDEHTKLGFKRKCWYYI